ELVEAVEQRTVLGDALLDVALHVLALVQRWLLSEHAHRRARRKRGVAAEVLVEPRHDAQERRLARAVVSEDADLRAWIEGERDVLEDRPVGRVHLREAVHREDVLRGHGLAGYVPTGLCPT